MALHYIQSGFCSIQSNVFAHIYTYLPFLAGFAYLSCIWGGLSNYPELSKAGIFSPVKIGSMKMGIIDSKIDPYSSLIHPFICACFLFCFFSCIFCSLLHFVLYFSFSTSLLGVVHLSPPSRASFCSATSRMPVAHCNFSCFCFTR